MKQIIYNVLVNGISVGLTFKLTEAQDWKASTTSRNVKIYKVDYYASRT
jgi:hypothetical protein